MSVGVIWLLAAISSGISTLVFREDSIWYPTTLAASGVAIVIGIVALIRFDRTIARASVVLGFLWVAMYVALLLIQIDDVQAWTANLFFALLGATASLVSWRKALAPTRS